MTKKERDELFDQLIPLQAKLNRIRLILLADHEAEQHRLRVERRKQEEEKGGAHADAPR